MQIRQAHTWYWNTGMIYAVHCSERIFLLAKVEEIEEDFILVKPLDSKHHSSSVSFNPENTPISIICQKSDGQKVKQAA